LAQLLASSHGNITVVGDFAQAIYSWRGADIRNLQRFSADFENAKTYRLEVNYRSTQRILAYAYEKISQNSSHPILQLQTENAPGEMVVERSAENEEQEALLVTATIADGIKHQGMRYDNFAVLYRTNAQSRAIEEALLHADMPYALVGGVRFYDRKEIKDILAYLRLLIYRDDPVAQERIQKLGKRKYAAFWLMYPELHTYLSVGSPDSIIEVVLSRTGYMDQFNKDDLEDVSRIENIKELKNVASRMTTLDAFFDHVSLIESERYEGERKHAGAGVKLMSLHASKGLEFDTVFIVGLEEGILPHSRSVDDTYALEEERRLFYVGITRARRRLYISWAQRRGMWGRRQYAVRSRFITQPTPPESSKIDDIINNWDVDPSVNQWSRYDDDQVTF
jgi:DNA helicase-2/ATP-dependent DNA helicase PcrA